MLYAGSVVNIYAGIYAGSVVNIYASIYAGSIVNIYTQVYTLWINSPHLCKSTRLPECLHAVIWRPKRCQTLAAVRRCSWLYAVKGYAGHKINTLVMKHKDCQHNINENAINVIYIYIGTQVNICHVAHMNVITDILERRLIYVTWLIWMSS